MSTAVVTLVTSKENREGFGEYGWEQSMAEMPLKKFCIPVEKD